MGRNLEQFNLGEVEIFGSYLAPYKEMAGHFGVSVKTIGRRMNDLDSEFCRAYRKGAFCAIRSLRVKRLRLALRGNVRMLIWLGKKYLGQSNKPRLYATGTAQMYFEIDQFSEATKRQIAAYWVKKKGQEAPPDFGEDEEGDFDPLPLQ